MKVSYRKLNTGNYYGHYGKYYILIRKREHFKYEGFEKYVFWYTAYIGLNGEWIYAEGMFGSYLKTIKKAKSWVKEKLKSIS